MVELGDVEPFVLAGATHLLHRQRPRAMAEALAGSSPATRSRPLDGEQLRLVAQVERDDGDVDVLRGNGRWTFDQSRPSSRAWSGSTATCRAMMPLE